MALRSLLLVGLTLLLINVFARSDFATAATIHNISQPFNRTLFPPDFMFGVASSAYQFEGAAFEDGKGPSNWDNFTHLRPCKIANCSNGDVAADFYHRYKDDVKLLNFIGMNALRFSISWPRILPTGKLSGGVNPDGVNFYKNLIGELKKYGIKPVVTLFHFDTPQALEDEYGGFLNDNIVDDFRDYADLCFKEFGNDVKHWITINEPQTFSHYAYDYGLFAPGRCSPWRGQSCSGGNSSTEPYIVAHNLILSHAAAVKIYKEKYQASQKGEISMALSSYWFVPYSNSSADFRASRRALDFFVGWYLHPLTYGDYPESMRKIVGERLPKFTPEQAVMVKGSFDFIGLNYYTGLYTSNIPGDNSINASYTTDMHANLLTERNGVALGKPTGVDTFFIYPEGFRKFLVYTSRTYNKPTIYITETGLADANNVTAQEGVKDSDRIYFYHTHLQALREAMKAGVNVKGVLGWAFLDNMEWASGYTVRFGIIYVDFENGLKRYLKHSAYWFKRFLLK